MLRALACAGAAPFLPGCYPRFDWRELHSEEGRFRVLMPARWRHASGTGSAGMPLSMWTSEADGAVFGVGYAEYADGAAAHFEAVRDGLGRNIQGKLVTDAETRSPGGLSGRAIRLDGTSQNRARRMDVRLYASGQRLYQLAVISTPEGVPDSALETFFTSFATY